VLRDDGCHRCAELRRDRGISRVRAIATRIWGEDELEVEPPRCCCGGHTGGQVLGAFEGDKLVVTRWHLPRSPRRALSPLALTGVLAAYRDRGVGRQLKLYQEKKLWAAAS